MEKEHKDYLTLNHYSKNNQNQCPQFVIVESVPENKKTILQDKSFSCKNNFQMQKSSKILVQDSISKEKELKPFWNDYCKEIESHLLSHIEIDSVDSDLNCSNILSNKMVENSWFSTKMNVVQNKSSIQTYLQSCTFSPVGCMDLENIVRKSKKIRIYPTKEQKKLFFQWIGVGRYVYNITIDYLKKHSNKKFNWMEFAKILFKTLPEFCKDVPYQIKKIAVKEAYQNVIKNKIKVKSNGGSFQMRFKSRKEPHQSCYIPKSAINDKGIFYTKSGILKFSEKMPIEILDSRLVFQNERWFICIPTTEKNVITFENQERIVAIDPGIRTFTSFFSENSFGQIGKHDIGRIYRLCYHLDKLMSKISKCENKRRKRSYKRATNRLRWKIKNLVDELHNKIIKFYVDNFDIILFPNFETSQITIKKKRKLCSKSVRQMLTFRFYDFSRKLKQKCFENGKICVRVDESYTSKTNSFNGKLMNIGSKEYFEYEGIKINRDINGARNILIRALRDFSINKDNS